MAFRGRGRGRGFGARPNYADQKSVPLFPSDLFSRKGRDSSKEDVELPNPKYVQGDNALLAWHGRLASYWRSSPYLMEEKATDEKKELVDIETYLHRATKSKRKWTKESASAFLKLEPGYFPLELVEGVKARVNKKVRWKQIKDEEDVFRKYEKGPNKENNNKVRKESDDEDEEKEEEEGSDASSAGDYSQNEDFDDDEDDFNDDDGGGDEGGFY